MVKIIIVGGGFAGLAAAQALKNTNVEIVLFDKANHHVFQPLLYQVATASLPASSISSSFREIFNNQSNVTVFMSFVDRIDLKEQCIHTEDKQTYKYDYLILAPGAKHSYFGNPSWEKHAPGLKTIFDATVIRERILLAFENAEKNENPLKSKLYLNFAIVGAGPTGVEIAGSIGEFTRQTLKNNFRRINPEKTNIYLIEGENQVLPSYPKKLADKAKEYLENLGVTVLLNTLVTDITTEGIYIGEKFLEASTTIWAAGNQASQLLKTLNQPLDRQGRVIVEPDLSIFGFPNVFVVGDAAAIKDKEGKILPGVAPVAMQEGRYVAKIMKKQTPLESRKPFKYIDKGLISTIGRGKAVGFTKKFTFSGFTAWIIWSLVHIFYLVNFKNRLFVMIQWIYLYLKNSRINRIIENPLHK